MPDVVKIAEIQEPWIEATILTPDEYLGSVLKLCQDRRGIQKELTYVGNRAMVILRPAAQRGGLRFLRPAEVDLQGLRLVRLSDLTDYKRGRPRQDVDPRQRRAGRCAVDAGAPLRRRGRGRAMCEKLKDLIPQAHVPDPDPGGDRRQGDRARDDLARCART
jgi:GTP-binding protein LepA